MVQPLFVYLPGWLTAIWGFFAIGAFISIFIAGPLTDQGEEWAAPTLVVCALFLALSLIAAFWFFFIPLGAVLGIILGGGWGAHKLLTRRAKKDDA